MTVSKAEGAIHEEEAMANVGRSAASPRRFHTTHMCVDVEGAVLNLSRSRARMAAGYRHDDGRPMTREEAISALMREFAQGRRVIPMGDCDDFDYQTGCRGHDASASEPAAKPTP